MEPNQGPSFCPLLDFIHLQRAKKWERTRLREENRLLNTLDDDVFLSQA